MKLTVENITPTKAKGLLKGNTCNRKIRETVVARYARDMRAGAWDVIGDPIRLNGDGTLLDGQHRLLAVIASGKAQKMVVVRGVSKAAMLNIDTGAKRSLSDILKLQGVKHATAVAAAMRWGVMYECPERVPTKGVATHSECVGWLEENPQIVDHVAAVTGRHTGQLAYRGILTALTMIRHYADDAAEFDLFADRLRSGADLKEGSPILALRRFTENAAITKTRVYSPLVYSAVTIKAWNAWLEGRTMSVLAFRAGGKNPEAFPVIVTGS